MRAAIDYAAQSDPEINRQFRRKWELPPPKTKSARPVSATVAGADFEDAQQHPYTTILRNRPSPVVIWLGRRHRLRPSIALVVADATGLGEP